MLINDKQITVRGERARNLKKKKRKKTEMRGIFIIFLILFLDLIAFTSILPLFPSIIDFYDKRDNLSAEKDASLRNIHGCMEWLKTSLGMPDRRRYNNVLVGGKTYFGQSCLIFLSLNFGMQAQIISTVCSKINVFTLFKIPP